MVSEIEMEKGTLNWKVMCVCEEEQLPCFYPCSIYFLTTIHEAMESSYIPHVKPYTPESVLHQGDVPTSNARQAMVNA